MAELKSAYGSSPRSLESPVPGGVAQANAQDAYSNVAKDASALDEAYAKVGQEAGSKGPQVTPPEPQEPGMVSKGLDIAGRALDYGGGLVRTGLAEVAGLAQGRTDVVNTEDLKNAAKGRAPLSAEYLRRLGVPEGGSLTFLGERFTTRGAVGLAADIATDPLTAITRLTKEAPYIDKIINSPGIASQAAGEAIYKSAFKKIDAKLAERGEEALSPIMMEQGITGSSKNIEKQVTEMSDTMGKLRQGLYDKANQKLVSIDLNSKNVFQRAESVLERMKQNPNMLPATQELEGMIENFKGVGSVPINVISDWKTALYDTLPKSAFDSFGKVKGQAQQFKAALAADFRKLVIDEGNRVEPGLGDAINVINEKWGTLLNAQKPLAKQTAGAASGGSLGTTIDGILLGSGQLPAFATKKSLDLMSTPYARTVAGKALMQAGQNGLAGAMSRRAAIEAQRAYQSQQQNFSPMQPPPSAVPDTGQSMGQQIQEVGQGTPVGE